MQYQLPIFENLCPSWLKHLDLGIRREFPKNTLVFDMESPVDGVYLVVEGSVEVILHNLNGPEKVLYYAGPGSIFGEVSCWVSGENDEAHVRSRTVCVCYFFHRDLVEGPIARDLPFLLIELIRAEAYKIRMYGILLRDSLEGDNFLRVCKNLIYLAHFRQPGLTDRAGSVAIRPEISQTDLARLMGIHRVTVTKSINRLKKMGILAGFSKNQLVILNFSALCALAEKTSPPD